MRPCHMLVRLAVLAFVALSLAAGSSAQTSPPTAKFTKLADFGNGNGQYPDAPLAQGLDGGFFGTSQNGPYPSNGFAFKMTATGPSPHSIIPAPRTTARATSLMPDSSSPATATITESLRTVATAPIERTAIQAARSSS